MVDTNKEEALLEKQWEEFNDENPSSGFTKIDDDKLKEQVVKDLTYVSAMDVKEYTLFQKWCEVQEKYPTVVSNTLWAQEERFLADEDQRFAIAEIKANFWNPEDPMEFENLQPELVITDKNDKFASPNLWNCIRTFSSTMKNNSNIGRNLNFIVRDKPTRKYLGVICISGDFLDLTPRDKYIGWDRKEKTAGMINHTAIGSTIVPLQPLGFNYAGGKLLALLCLSDVVQKMWERDYKDKLVGVTTTSLYGKTKAGGLSQYDNLDFWEPMGFTSGSVSFEPLRETRYAIREWLKVNHTRKYFEWYVAKRENGQPWKRDHKNRSLAFTYGKMGIPKELIRSEHARGIYFSPLYNETNDYLCGRIDESKLTRRFDNSVENLVSVWKNKHARGRIRQLMKQKKVSKDTLFYDDLAFLSWDEVKAKYLPQVGR